MIYNPWEMIEFDWPAIRLRPFLHITVPLKPLMHYGYRYGNGWRLFP